VPLINPLERALSVSKGEGAKQSALIPNPHSPQLCIFPYFISISCATKWEDNFVSSFFKADFHFKAIHIYQSCFKRQHTASEGRSCRSGGARAENEGNVNAELVEKNARQRLQSVTKDKDMLSL
jgi:hypothetical protein